jgi:hypothetical protein
VRNRSEEKKTYQISGYRLVREETFFKVDAKDDSEAKDMAEDVIFNFGCEWAPDYESVPTEEGFDLDVVTSE